MAPGNFERFPVDKYVKFPSMPEIVGVVIIALAAVAIAKRVPVLNKL